MPNDYISREAAISAIREAAIPCNEIFYAGVVSAFKAVNSVPAADVVPVVRCKDCEHWGHDHDAGRWCWCRSLDIGTAPDFYCKDGCRMDGGENHAD